MNIPTRKKDDELMMEGYNPNDPAYNRTPKKQAEIDKEIAGFNKNTEEYHEKNPYADPLRKYRRKRFRGEGAEEESSPTKAVTNAIDELAATLEGNEKVAAYEDLRDYLKARLSS